MWADGGRKGGQGRRGGFFYPNNRRESSPLTSHLPLFPRSTSLRAFLSRVPDILAPLIATFAGRVGIQVRPPQADGV